MDIDLPPLVAHALLLTDTLKYFLLFIGVMIEGPVLIVLSGFLLHFDVLSFWPLVTVIILGDLLGDVAWYYVGYHFADPFARKFGRFFGLTDVMLEKAKILFHKYHEMVLFISKVTLGFGLAIGTLMVAGATRVSFYRFMFLNFLGEIVLVTTLMTLGYFFGNLYTYIDKGFRALFLVTVAVFVGLVVYGVTNYFKQKAMKL